MTTSSLLRGTNTYLSGVVRNVFSCASIFSHLPRHADSLSLVIDFRSAKLGPVAAPDDGR